MNDQNVTPRVTKCNSCGGWVPVSRGNGLEATEYNLESTVGRDEKLWNPSVDQFVIEDEAGGGFLLRTKEGLEGNLNARGDSTVKVYLTFNSQGAVVFTSNETRALRFSRKMDAESMANYLTESHWTYPEMKDMDVIKREPEHDLTSIGA